MTPCIVSVFDQSNIYLKLIHIRIVNNLDSMTAFVSSKGRKKWRGCNSNRQEVRPLLTMKETLEAVERAFREKGFGKVQMPPKLYVFFKNIIEILELCYIFREKRYRSVKIVNVHPKNPERHLR